MAGAMNFMTILRPYFMGFKVSLRWWVVLMVAVFKSQTVNENVSLPVTHQTNILGELNI